MNLLICSIGSKQRQSTLTYAAELAQALASKVTLLGVVDKKRKVEPLGIVMDEVARTLKARDIDVQVRVDVGDAERTVLQELEQNSYDLVAIGALAGMRAHRAFSESVAKRISERWRGSVLVIKGKRKSIERVLICSSGFERGRLSVWTGAAVACAAGAEATLLHVLDPIPAMYTGLERMEETLSEFLQSDTDLSDELRWAAQVVKAECRIAELKVRRGIVADEILSEGQRGDYDLIVLGSTLSDQGIYRLLLNDVTSEVMERAQRPVLIVRPAE